jgi:hyperosmotically inducible protein
MKTSWSRPLAAGSVFALTFALAACGGRPEPQEPIQPSVQTTVDQGERQAKALRSDHVLMKMGGDEPPMAAEAPVSEDTQIEMQASTTLGSDRDLSGVKIDVDSQDGVVTLRGRAPDPEARERATQLIQGLRKVRAVENQLTLG